MFRTPTAISWNFSATVLRCHEQPKPQEHLGKFRHFKWRQNEARTVYYKAARWRWCIPLLYGELPHFQIFAKMFFLRDSTIRRVGIYHDHSFSLYSHGNLRVIPRRKNTGLIYGLTTEGRMSRGVLGGSSHLVSRQYSWTMDSKSPKQACSPPKWPKPQKRRSFAGPLDPKVFPCQNLFDLL